MLSESNISLLITCLTVVSVVAIVHGKEFKSKIKVENDSAEAEVSVTEEISEEDNINEKKTVPPAK